MDFSDTLINWYAGNKRNLPWRNTTNPYIIWLSEIILQQTRVEQGLPYFYKFAESYPTITDFANATEDEILKLWQGLGYYSRGRNMLATARLVQQNFNGKFPKSYNDLIKLKGIGSYTAAAISSFAANEARAVVDGNVYRVLARYFGITEAINSTTGTKLFQQTANEVLNTAKPALHNQAIMEFGALLCKPKNPACGVCPFNQTCNAFLHNAVAALPVKLKKTKVRERWFNYFLFTDGKKIVLNKRSPKGIWANMYDLPLIETAGNSTIKELMQLPEVKKAFGNLNNVADVEGPYTHLLTHQKLKVNFIILIKPPGTIATPWFYAEVENLKKLALPQIIFLFLTKFFKFKFNLSVS